MPTCTPVLFYESPEPSHPPFTCVHRSCVVVDLWFIFFPKRAFGLRRGEFFFCGCTISGGFVRLSAMASLECKHPTCSGETCRRPKKEKKRYYIPRVSVKKKSELEQYKEARISFLKGKVCEICGKKATEVHHKKGRGVLLNAIEYWMAICRKCHIGITEHSKEAIEKGYSIKRNV